LIARRIAAVLAGEGGQAAPSSSRAPGSQPGAPRITAVASPSARRPGSEIAVRTDVITGVIASRGIAVGTAYHLRTVEFEVPERGAGIEQETAELERARRTVRKQLANTAATGATTTQAGIAEAHVALLDDPALLAAAERVLEKDSSAGHAWRMAIEEQAAALERLDDAYLRERAADLRDLEAQVLAALGLQPRHAVAALPARAIVLAKEILPSQFAALDTTRLAGLCTVGGGPTSHVAIMASAIGLPMVVAAGEAIDAVPDGREVILDAQVGELHVAPDAQALAAAERTCAQDRDRREAQRVAAGREGRTRDGRRIHVYSNLGSPAEATAAVSLGAEGCGLLRTEFLFLGRRTPPSEDEQLEVYQQIASRLDGRPLTIRTLDAGGDKPIDYLPLPAEENPALGLRGVRTSLWRPELLRTQLRAILRVQPPGQCRILLPMVTDVSDIAAVRTELAAAHAAVGNNAAVPALGVMIETPAAAVLADTLAAHVDFFSIGTNDLTQYTLAMDRGHPALAPRIDGLHPAVLRLIDKTAHVARTQGRECAVCGNLAVDAQAIPILVGLGVQELSVAAAAVPSVKARLAELDFETCRALAARALDCATPAEVRALVAQT
jgi:multiphosphoryl transfer protein